MSIVVLGDALLDVDLDGSSTRLSPDGPVPVVDVSGAIERAGGAGLVARMLARDGHDVTLVTVLSDDRDAARLRAALRGVPVIAGPSGAPTPVKTRIRVSGQTVVRFDEGCATPPLPSATPEMIAAVASADAVVVADYGRRLTENPDLRRALEAVRGPVVWDPHPRGADPVPTATVVTPNAHEAGVHPGNGPNAVVSRAEDAAAALRLRWGCAAVAVTLGELGALLLEGRPGSPAAGARYVPTPSPASGDTCGAGDRFASALAVGLRDGLDLPEALEAAVRQTGPFLAEGGVAALDAPEAPAPARLRHEASDALDVIRRTRAAGGSVVATGGCFDLIHAGHLRTLAAARALGDCLVVCLNSDESVRRLKGPERPIIGQDDRRELLLAMECVDAVVVFGEDTPDTVLRRLEPDVWVKGGDYRVEDLPEAQLVGEWGGRCVTVPYAPARSTTRLASALARVS